MPWNTNIDWTDVDTLVNVSTEILEDFIGATTERLNALGVTISSSVAVNAPNSTALRGAMVDCVEGVGSTGQSRIHFVKPVGTDYSWHNQSAITHWDMTAMETTLGAEPDHGVNAPLTASWLLWWYNALNLLTHCEYGEVFGGFVPGASQRSLRRGYAFQSTYDAAVDDFDADTWDSWGSSAFIFAPYHRVL